MSRNERSTARLCSRERSEASRHFENARGNAPECVCVIFLCSRRRRRIRKEGDVPQRCGTRETGHVNDDESDPRPGEFSVEIISSTDTRMRKVCFSTKASNRDGKDGDERGGDVRRIDGSPARASAQRLADYVFRQTRTYMQFRREIRDAEERGIGKATGNVILSTRIPPTHTRILITIHTFIL